jgi:hypothetical protein
MRCVHRENEKRLAVMSCNVDACPRIQCFATKRLDAAYWFSVYCGPCSSKRRESDKECQT